MTTSLFASVPARRRILAVQWEANCERIGRALGTVVEPFGGSPTDLSGAIARARELLLEMEALHLTDVQGDSSGTDASAGIFLERHHEQSD